MPDSTTYLIQEEAAIAAMEADRQRMVEALEAGGCTVHQWPGSPSMHDSILVEIDPDNAESVAAAAATLEDLFQRYGSEKAHQPDLFADLDP